MNIFSKECRTPVFGLALVMLFLSGNARAEIAIPAAGDWTDRGTVLQPGNGWDKRLTGALSPSAVVKKDGIFYLYYVGADGDRSTDGGPRNRALGVATSTDGVNFTKYGGNPVITHLPHNNQEEGVFSAATTLDANGNIVLYYGAIWASNSTTESVDVYVALATSTDGFAFDDRGSRGEYVYKEVGEEVEPIGVVRDGGTWHIYYLNNRGWTLNLLSGPAIDSVNRIGRVSGVSSAKGGAEPILLNDSDFVTFVRDEATSDALVMTGSLSDLRNLTQIDRYRWGAEDFKGFTVMLDLESETWLMYYKNSAANTIGLKTAPMVNVDSDTLPPKSPSDLRAQ